VPGKEKEEFMEKKTYGGKEIEIDEDGFIQDPEVWDQAVAVDLRRQKASRT